MQKKLITIISLGILITSCIISNQKYDADSNISIAERNPQLISVDIDNVKKSKKIKLSEVFKRAKTIILETNKNAMISQANIIQVCGNQIFILDSSGSKGLYVFNKEGRFIRKIGSVGQGSDEYVQPSDFTIDKRKKIIYVLDSQNQNILKYNLATGTFISNIKLNDKSNKSYHIQCVGDKLYSDAYNKTKLETTFLIQEINLSTGERERKWLPTSIYNCGISNAPISGAGYSVFFDKMQDSPKFCESFMDTVITFSKNGVMPYLAIKSKDVITQSFVSTLSGPIQEGVTMSLPKIHHLSGFMTYKDIMYYFYNKSGGTYEFIYNKTTGKTSELEQDEDFKYENDKNQLISWPRFNTSSDDGIYGIVRPYDMPKFLKLAKEGKLAKNLDKRDQLMKLDAKSNPVIFVYQK
jgi:hypothetical protein